MRELITSLGNLISEHGSELLLSVVSFAAGGLWAWLQAWRSWANRAFYDQVNVSLNFVDEGQFEIRTLLERSSGEVFRNREMLRRVLRAARSANKSPLLNVEAEDYWYYLNAVLNVISEKFAEGYVRQEARAASSHTYLLFLTSETETQVRQRKVRAMLVRESLLLDTLNQTPAFKNEFHEIRWETLKTVAREWTESGGKTPRVREISIPL